MKMKILWHKIAVCLFVFCAWMMNWRNLDIFCELAYWDDGSCCCMYCNFFYIVINILWLALFCITTPFPLLVLRTHPIYLLKDKKNMLDLRQRMVRVLKKRLETGCSFNIAIETASSAIVKQNMTYWIKPINDVIFNFQSIKWKIYLNHMLL